MGAAGTDIAMETADVVLLGDSLQNIPFAISLSRHARTVIWENFTIAIGVILVLIISLDDLWEIHFLGLTAQDCARNRSPVLSVSD